jgi:hypothetical protein
LIDPQRYLHYVLERIADHPINRIDELLPWNVAAQLNHPRRLRRRWRPDEIPILIRRVLQAYGE